MASSGRSSTPLRGILEDEYDVKASSIHWRNGGLEEGGREERAPLHLPDEIDLQSIPKDETLAEHLNDGRLDAVISARAPSCYNSNDKIDRLFPDYPAVERAYERADAINTTPTINSESRKVLLGA